MGTWNVLSLTVDDHLSLLSSELKHLNIGIAALSEVRRSDSGEIMGGDYTNYRIPQSYWSGHFVGSHGQGVAAAVPNKLTPMIIEVTPVNERVMRLRIRHFLGVISLVCVYSGSQTFFDYRPLLPSWTGPMPLVLSFVVGHPVGNRIVQIYVDWKQK